MTKEQAIDYFRTTGALAAALGCAQSTVSEWKDIPEGRQYQIELATKGKLKADLPALRKDVKPITKAEEVDRLTTVVEQSTKALAAALTTLERLRKGT